MPTPQPSFEDPSLKAALRAFEPADGASPLLRDRVRTAMASATPEPVTPDPVAPDRMPPIARYPLPRLLKLAAMIAVGVGLGTVALQWYEQRQADAELAANMNAPARTMWEQMADLHEAGGASASCHAPLTSPLTDPAALAAEGTKQLGHHVVVPKLGSAWTLDAATLASIAGQSAVRFHFTSGEHSVTVLSMPESAWTYRKSDQYTTTADGHAIAGFVKAEGLHCVVGDRRLPMADVQRLADQLRAQ